MAKQRLLELEKDKKKLEEALAESEEDVKELRIYMEAGMPNHPKIIELTMENSQLVQKVKQLEKKLGVSKLKQRYLDKSGKPPWDVRLEAFADRYKAAYGDRGPSDYASVISNHWSFLLKSRRLSYQRFLYEMGRLEHFFKEKGIPWPIQDNLSFIDQYLHDNVKLESP